MSGALACVLPLSVIPDQRPGLRDGLLHGEDANEVIAYAEVVALGFEIPNTLSVARAHEIALTAQRMIVRKKIAWIQPWRNFAYAAH